MKKAIVITEDEWKEMITDSIGKAVQAAIIELRAEISLTRELMTTAQTAEYLQCSHQSIKNWTKRGKNENQLPFGNAGADPRFHRSKVDAWMDKERIVRQQCKEKDDQPASLL